MASDTKRPRPVGINHVALEVGDVERALDFYGRLFDISRVERAQGGAFVELGDQFIAMFEPGAHEDRHFGLVVDDKEAARAVLAAEAVELLPTGRLDFRDPFGNRVQVVQYDEIQFLKASTVLQAMGLGSLAKTEAANGAGVSDHDDFSTWVNTVLYEAELALHNGDAGPRRAIWSRREPVSVLGAWRNAHGRQELEELFTSLAASFSDCTSFRFELQAFDVVGDMAYTAGLEHTSASVDGQPRSYSLRATQVYRREGGEWKVAHRHGDTVSE